MTRPCPLTVHNSGSGLFLNSILTFLCLLTHHLESIPSGSSIFLKICMSFFLSWKATSIWCSWKLCHDLSKAIHTELVGLLRRMKIRTENSQLFISLSVSMSMSVYCQFPFLFPCPFPFPCLVNINRRYEYLCTTWQLFYRFPRPLQGSAET